MILNMNSVEWARKCVQMVNKRKTTGETNQMETDDPEKEISKYSLHTTQQTLRKLQVEVRYCLNKLGHAWPRAGIEWKTTWNSKGPWEFNLCDQSSLVLTLWRSKSLLHYKLWHYALFSLYAQLHFTLKTPELSSKTSIPVNCSLLSLRVVNTHRIFLVHWSFWSSRILSDRRTPFFPSALIPKPES